MFFSRHVIENSLFELEKVHPFFGISFLVFKQAKLPIGRMEEIKINHLEEQFLQEYYRPDGRSKWFFRPFRISVKNKYWKLRNK